MAELPSARAGVKRFSQNQNRCALDSNAGEGSRAPRPGVDVDSVMPDIGMWHRHIQTGNLRNKNRSGDIAGTIRVHAEGRCESADAYRLPTRSSPCAD